MATSNAGDQGDQSTQDLNEEISNQNNEKFVKDDTFKTIANKENLNLGDGDAQIIENSTFSEMESLENETTGFDGKFVKVNSSSHFFNFF